jgi:hypothetical protein
MTQHSESHRRWSAVALMHAAFQSRKLMMSRILGRRSVVSAVLATALSLLVSQGTVASDAAIIESCGST